MSWGKNKRKEKKKGGGGRKKKRKLNIIVIASLWYKRKISNNPSKPLEQREDFEFFWHISLLWRCQNLRCLTLLVFFAICYQHKPSTIEWSQLKPFWLAVPIEHIFFLKFLINCMRKRIQYPHFSHMWDHKFPLQDRGQVSEDNSLQRTLSNCQINNFYYYLCNSSHKAFKGQFSVHLNFTVHDSRDQWWVTT